MNIEAPTKEQVGKCLRLINKRGVKPCYGAKMVFVPHASWGYSGYCSCVAYAASYLAYSPQSPETLTIKLIGTNHQGCEPSSESCITSEHSLRVVGGGIQQIVDLSNTRLENTLSNRLKNSQKNLVIEPILLQRGISSDDIQREALSLAQWISGPTHDIIPKEVRMIVMTSDLSHFHSLQQATIDLESPLLKEMIEGTAQGAESILQNNPALTACGPDVIALWCATRTALKWQGVPACSDDSLMRRRFWSMTPTNKTFVSYFSCVAIDPKSLPDPAVDALRGYYARWSALALARTAVISGIEAQQSSSANIIKKPSLGEWSFLWTQTNFGAFVGVADNFFSSQQPTFSFLAKDGSCSWDKVLPSTSEQPEDFFNKTRASMGRYAQEGQTTADNISHAGTMCAEDASGRWRRPLGLLPMVSGKNGIKTQEDWLVYVNILLQNGYDLQNRGEPPQNLKNHSPSERLGVTLFLKNGSQVATFLPSVRLEYPQWTWEQYLDELSEKAGAVLKRNSANKVLSGGWRSDDTARIVLYKTSLLYEDCTPHCEAVLTGSLQL